MIISDFCYCFTDITLALRRFRCLRRMIYPESKVSDIINPDKNTKRSEIGPRNGEYHLPTCSSNAIFHSDILALAISEGICNFSEAPFV